MGKATQSNKDLFASRQTLRERHLFLTIPIKNIVQKSNKNLQICRYSGFHFAYGKMKTQNS
jgi:hypothetical protein